MPARILVVEDNPANQHLMQYLLKAFGYAVLTANDGAEAVAIAERERPDIVLMDLQLPVLDGYQAMAKIRTLPAAGGVPIIAVTAFAMVGDRDRILARGFDGYIAKPIVPESFVASVEAFIPEALRSQGPGAAR